MALGKTERPLRGAPHVEGGRVFFLTLFPLLEEELNVKLARGDEGAFTSKPFDIAFEPKRANVL